VTSKPSYWTRSAFHQASSGWAYEVRCPAKRLGHGLGFGWGLTSCRAAGAQCHWRQARKTPEIVFRPTSRYLSPIQQRLHHRLGRIQPMVHCSIKITTGPPWPAPAKTVDGWIRTWRNWSTPWWRVRDSQLPKQSN